MCSIWGCHSVTAELAPPRPNASAASKPESIDTSSAKPRGIRLATHEDSGEIPPDDFAGSDTIEPPSTDALGEAEPFANAEAVVPRPVEMGQAPAAEMSLADFEQIALQSNPALAQAAARVFSLRGKWVQAGLPPNPSLAYQGVEIGNDGAAGLQGAAITQQIITGHKLRLGREVVAREVLAAQQRQATVERRVLTDVRSGYYDVLIAQRKVELVEGLVAAANDSVHASQLLFDAQEIPRIALLQNEVEAENSEILLRRAQNESAAAWRRLISVLGQPMLPPARLAGSLEHTAEQLDWDVEIDRLMTASPELATAMAEIERSQWALDRAAAQAIPNVTVQLGAQYDYGTEDAVANVQVGMPIPLWNRNQGGVQQAEAEIVAAQRNFQRVELDLTQRLAAAFQAYATAQYQVARYQNSILPRVKETFDLVSQGYKQGELGFLEQLTAQRTYFQTNLAYIAALRDLWRATVAIEGQLLDQSLQATGP